MMAIVDVALYYLGHCLEDSSSGVLFENKRKVILQELLSKIITWMWLVCSFLKYLFLLSSRKGANRYLTVRKKDGSERKHAVMTCALTPGTKHAACTLIRNFPVTNKERTELLPKKERGNAYAGESGMFSVFCDVDLSINTTWKNNPKTNPSVFYLFLCHEWHSSFQTT